MQKPQNRKNRQMKKSQKFFQRVIAIRPCFLGVSEERMRFLLSFSREEEIENDTGTETTGI